MLRIMLTLRFFLGVVSIDRLCRRLCSVDYDLALILQTLRLREQIIHQTTISALTLVVLVWSSSTTNFASGMISRLYYFKCGLRFLTWLGRCLDQLYDTEWGPPRQTVIYSHFLDTIRFYLDSLRILSLSWQTSKTGAVLADQTCLSITSYKINLTSLIFLYLVLIHHILFKDFEKLFCSCRINLTYLIISV